MTDTPSILILSAVTMFVVGVILLAVVSPLIGGIVIVVGLADLAIAMALRGSGR
jgi:hypothetical protein